MAVSPISCPLIESPVEESWLSISDLGDGSAAQKLVSPTFIAIGALAWSFALTLNASQIIYDARTVLTYENKDFAVLGEGRAQRVATELASLFRRTMFRVVLFVGQICSVITWLGTIGGFALGAAAAPLKVVALASYALYYVGVLVDGLSSSGRSGVFSWKSAVFEVLAVLTAVCTVVWAVLSWLPLVLATAVPPLAIGVFYLLATVLPLVPLTISLIDHAIAPAQRTT